LADEVEFDWDGPNRRHLAAHKVTPAEFEQVMSSDPLDLACEVIGEEERYRSVGLTSRGRLLTVVWTIRNGKVRAVTAFPAPPADRRTWREFR
jgi:uncharacterized protein